MLFKMKRAPTIVRYWMLEKENPQSERVRAGFRGDLEQVRWL